MAHIYRIRSLTTGHYYIGAALDISRREDRHLKDIAAGKKPKRWQRMWTEYPELRDPVLWKVDVIKEFATLEEAAEAESDLLQIHVGLPLCLNQTRTSSTQGSMTQESREKESKTKRGRTLSDEHRANLSKTLSGRKLSDEHRAKIRQRAKEQHARRRAEKAISSD